jgi:hypothetical protein
MRVCQVRVVNVLGLKQGSVAVSLNGSFDGCLVIVLSFFGLGLVYCWVGCDELDVGCAICCGFEVEADCDVDRLWF